MEIVVFANEASRATQQCDFDQIIVVRIATDRELSTRFNLHRTIVKLCCDALTLAARNPMTT
jgi:hypothetical protein